MSITNIELVNFVLVVCMALNVGVGISNIGRGDNKAAALNFIAAVFCFCVFLV